MKITIWIRPDQRDPTGRTITLRTDFKLENHDNPVIQRYGRKLLNALEGTAEKPEEPALMEPNDLKAIREALDGMMYEAFSLCDSGIPPAIERGKLLAKWCDRLRAAMMPNQFISPTAGRAGSAETAEAKGSTSTGNSED